MTTPYITPFVNHCVQDTFAKIAHTPYSLLLDSADPTHNDARYSYILTNPLETIECKGDEITLTTREKLRVLRSKNPLDIVQERIHNFAKNIETVAGLPPFQGGAAGLLSYDLGRTLEELPNHAITNPDMPDMAIGIYDQVIAFDHELEQAWIITHARKELEAQMKQSVLHHNLSAPASTNSRIEHTPLQWQGALKPAAFKERINRVKNYILEGDIFQANLAHRFEATLPIWFDPYSHYQHLRTVNAAPFCSYFNLGEIKIASASPERFLQCTSQGHVSTKPIKGTIKRGLSSAHDAHCKDTLANSYKDRAENIMITDLMRNDLSKCCTPESINVPNLCNIESFTNLHHMVTEVTGTLREDQTPIDLLKATFPGGSITGAPKIRAMEIIEELETHQRGPYCGSIAVIGFNGTLDCSILIRTLVYEGNNVSLSVGGGITALSNADDEYEETMTKAKAVFDSFIPEEKPAKLAV